VGFNITQAYSYLDYKDKNGSGFIDGPDDPTGKQEGYTYLFDINVDNKLDMLECKIALLIKNVYTDDIVLDKEELKQIEQHLDKGMSFVADYLKTLSKHPAYINTLNGEQRDKLKDMLLLFVSVYSLGDKVGISKNDQFNGLCKCLKLSKMLPEGIFIMEAQPGLLSGVFNIDNSGYSAAEISKQLLADGVSRTDLIKLLTDAGFNSEQINNIFYRMSR
jgi:hypothetical protein